MRTFDIPARMAHLPQDHRGYPVPYFASWKDGKPDFRHSDATKWIRCVKQFECWVCGKPLNGAATFVSAAVCGFNRLFPEPGCHEECAEFSARVCPYLALPKAKRKFDGPGGITQENLGVHILWTTSRFRVVKPLETIEVGDPIAIRLFREGREEVYASVADQIKQQAAEIWGS